MTVKPLDRLLFLQGGLCFFCNAPLPRADASIEHLVALSRGGSNDDENCVACCKVINTILGSIPLKEKIRAVLNQKGKFTCPNRVNSASPSMSEAALKSQPVAPVKHVAPLKAAAAVKTVSQPKTATPAKADVPASAVASSRVVNLYSRVLADLQRRGERTPRTIKALKNTIREVAKSGSCSLTDAQLDILLRELQQNGKVKVSDTRVSYSL